jgi:circadian clock protein KaiB
MRAIENLTRVCQRELEGRYKLEVVDIYKEPRRAATDGIVAIPTLIKQAPGEVRRMIGDLSEVSIVMQGLGLN